MAMIQQQGDDCLLLLKVVPGSSRDAVAGVLGDRLKIKVAAAPEAGRANAAVCELLARALGIRPRDISVEAGATSPEKTVRVRGLTAGQLRAALDL
ncbi:MAG: DUF167 domain-containing protein [Phycisphaerales bacterium]